MIGRLLWYWKCDRLGPDILSTHVLLFFKRSATWICRRKFRSFGDGSEFRPYAFAHAPSNISIGRNVIIRPGTMLFADQPQEGAIVIEDDVGIGAGVHMYVDNHYYERTDVPIRDQGYFPSRPIRLCKGAWIGANSIILLGVTIGESAVVNPGSLVNTDVEPFTIVGGNPARLIKQTGCA